jgi:hypothetical protein
MQGVDGGGESVSRDSTRQLDRPATPEGEAGGRGGGSGAVSTLARPGYLTLRWGEGWCWATRSMLPWPPGRGVGEEQWWRAGRTTAHHKCWLATETNVGWLK